MELCTSPANDVRRSEFGQKRRRCLPADHPHPLRHGLESIVFKIADSQAEREAAFELVHEMYTREHLMAPNLYGMRVTPWHLLEGTNVFVAKDRGRVIHTLSAVPDGPKGLPMESIYGDEIHSRREAGIRLAEITCLAALRDAYSGDHTFHVFVQLVGLMFQSCRLNGIERLLIAVHPRHARFYCRALGFEQVGDVKHYESVCGRPAVACEHDFSRRDVDRYRLYDEVYRHRFDPLQLMGASMQEEEREYFSMISSWTDSGSPAFAA